MQSYLENFTVINRLQAEYMNWFIPQLLEWDKGRDFLPRPNFVPDMLLRWKVRLKADSTSILNKEELQELDRQFINGRLMVVMYHDNTPAGSIFLDLYEGKSQQAGEKVGELHAVYVRPEFRGMRLGKPLLQKIIKLAKENGYNRLVLDTNPFMKAAIALYKSCGFEQIGFVAFYYTDEEMAKRRDAIFMSLKL